MKDIDVVIKFKVKGITVELSLSEVKELAEALDTLVGKKVEKEYIPYPSYPWEPWWRYDPVFPNTVWSNDSISAKWDSLSVTMEART